MRGPAPDYQLSRERLLALLEERGLFVALSQCLDTIEGQAKEQGVHFDSIEAVLLVGGSTLLPGVYSFFEERFGRSRVRLSRAFRVEPNERLRKLLESDRYSRVRAQALAALVETSVADSTVERAIHAALDDRSATVRLAAARLAPVEAARSVILALCEGNNSDALRAEAFTVASERLERPDALSLLRTAIRDPSERIRMAAREALIAMGADPAEGAVSLVDAQGGEVTLTGTGGEVSLPDEE